jgi:hypothetical protein
MVIAVPLASALAVVILSGTAGDIKGTPSPRASVSHVPVLRLPHIEVPVEARVPGPGAEGSGEAATQEEGNQFQPPAAPEAPVGGAARDAILNRKWIFDMVVENEKQRQRQEMVDRLRAYMSGHHHVQGLIDLAPLMVELGEQTGNDCRLCPVTANEESSGGRVCCGSYNPFGALGMNFGSWEDAVRYYFRRITEYGRNGDVWSIAFIWYDSSDPGGRATNYANNVLGAVQSI